MVRPGSKTKRKGRAGARAGLTILLLAFCIAAAPAAEDPLLAKFAGDWVGRGTWRAGPKSEPERLYCKVTNRLVDGGAALEQKGRCAITSHSGRISGRIAAEGGGNYGGKLVSFSTLGDTKISGKGSGSKIELNAEFVDRLTRKPGEALVSLVVSGDGEYRLTSNTLGPDGQSRYVASDIVFTHE